MPYARRVLPPQRPIHAERLRDALGLLRLLYAAEADAVRRATIAEAGRRFTIALDQTRFELGSLAHRAAPGNAGHGFDALDKLELSTELRALLDVARKRTLEEER